MSIHGATQRLETLRSKHSDLETLNELDNYLQQKLDNPNEDHHYRHLHNALKIIQHNQEKDLQNIDEKIFSDILSQIERSTYATKTDDFSISTKNKYRKTLDYMLKMQGIEKGFKEFARPGVNIYQKTSDQKKTSKDDLLNPEELNTFLRKLQDVSLDRQVLRNQAFFYTLWNTGARTGGLIQVKMEDVTVREQVVEVTVPAHKDSPERADLPLYFAAPVLKRYLETVPEDQEYLFENREGGLMSYSLMREKALQIYQETPSIETSYQGQPLHIFRKSFKTYAGIMQLFDDPGNLDIWTGHALGSTQIKRLYDRRDTESAGNAMRQNLGLKTEDKKDWKQVLAPQTCQSCGEINSSHRKQCFSCGGVLKPKEMPSSITQTTEKERHKAEVIGRIKGLKDLLDKTDDELEDMIE